MLYKKKISPDGHWVKLCATQFYCNHLRFKMDNITEINQDMDKVPCYYYYYYWHVNHYHIRVYTCRELSRTNISDFHPTLYTYVQDFFLSLFYGMSYFIPIFIHIPAKCRHYIRIVHTPCSKFAHNFYSFFNAYISTHKKNQTRHM